jgi:hypothetical protein
MDDQHGTLERGQSLLPSLEHVSLDTNGVPATDVRADDRTDTERSADHPPGTRRHVKAGLRKERQHITKPTWRAHGENACRSTVVQGNSGEQVDLDDNGVRGRGGLARRGHG